MNILITAPSLNERENISGISTLVKTIINGCSGSDAYFHFRMGSRDGSKKGLRWVGEQIVLLPRMLKFIRKNKIDAVHLNTDFTKASLIRDFVILSFLKWVARKPVLLHIHGGYMLMKPPKSKTPYWQLISGLLNNSKVNIVLNQAEQHVLFDNFGIKCHVLPNTVNSPIKKKNYKNFHDKIKFIFLGRIVEQKGIYLIAAALEQLRDHHTEFSFIIYGTGQELPSLLTKLNAISTLDFEYKGVAVDAEKWHALEEANVFLLPSYGEGHPIAMLEAMLAGCIPVVSNDASMTSIVKNDLNGFIFEKGNHDHLAATLKTILKERESLARISDAARKTVSEKFSITEYMENLNNYYSTFLQQVQ